MLGHHDKSYIMVDSVQHIKATVCGALYMAIPVIHVRNYVNINHSSSSVVLSLGK